jgi:hypothetical protein
VFSARRKLGAVETGSSTTADSGCVDTTVGGSWGGSFVVGIFTLQDTSIAPPTITSKHGNHFENRISSPRELILNTSPMTTLTEAGNQRLPRFFGFGPN